MKSVLNRQRQQGATLVVSLILLSVIAVISMSISDTSTTEMKMSGSVRERGVAFSAAEATLKIVEKNLAENPPLRRYLSSSCSGKGCFNATCEGGLCFDGDFDGSYTEYECEVANYGKNFRRVDFWSDVTLDVWGNDSRHQKLKVATVNTEVKYIIEFLCFVPKDRSVPFSEDVNDSNNGAPLFRITSYASANGGRGKVVLQSTYKLLSNQ